MGLDLKSLSVREAQVVQHGLKALGVYKGTTRGRPGPLTEEALERWLTMEEEPRPGEFAEVLARVAEGEIGKKEVGNNGGPAVLRYQQATWLPPGPWPWCAAFVCWCYREAGVRLGGTPQKRPQTAAAWDFENWARSAGAELLKPAGGHLARRGDIVVFTFSHIGICVEDERAGNPVRTVEGNTNPAGSREGDGVYEKRRDKWKIRALIRC